jgi:hypothetical protein
MCMYRRYVMNESRTHTTVRAWANREERMQVCRALGRVDSNESRTSQSKDGELAMPIKALSD